MHRLRLSRVGLLFAAVLGLLGVMTPADAHVVRAGAVVFQGTATSAGGLSYPCVSAGSPTPIINPTGFKCSTPVLGNTTKPVTVQGGNIRTFSFGSTVCVGVGSELTATPGTVPPNTVTVGVLTGVLPACSLTASGIVTGSCGLSSGLGTFSLTLERDKVVHTLPTPSVMVLPNEIVLVSGDFHFVEVAHVLVVTGDTNEPGAEIDALAGVVTVFAPSFLNITPPSLANSCLNKTATTYELEGRFAFLTANIL